MNWPIRLEEAVHDARARTGVPGIVAGLSTRGERTFAAVGERVLDAGEPVEIDTPFRIASVTKPFTAELAARSLDLDDDVRALLSHTAGLRPESDDALPEACRGLWSYSNAGFWEVGRRIEAACASSFTDAMRVRVLGPLGLEATGFEEPEGAARGHVQEGETGHRAVLDDAYPAWRRPSGGLWSTVSDLLRFGEQRAGGDDWAGGRALGATYALGWWSREVGGRRAFDHEGSVGGYQSLLLVVPEDGVVFAALTNSWRGSGAIRRVVDALGLSPTAAAPPAVNESVAGTYALDDVEATVELRGESIDVTEAETDPVTGARIERRYPARPLGGGVYGFAGGVLQSHRLDFPRPDVARIGWVTMPRVSA